MILMLIKIVNIQLNFVQVAIILVNLKIACLIYFIRKKNIFSYFNAIIFLNN